MIIIKRKMIRQTDGNYRLDHAVTATQKEILKAFDVTERNIREQAIEINQKLQMIDQIKGDNDYGQTKYID